MALVTPLLTTDTFRTWLATTNTVIGFLNSNTVVATVNAVGAFSVGNTTHTNTSLTIYHSAGGSTLANSTGLFLAGNTTFSGLNFTANATSNVFTVSSNTTLLESPGGTTINSNVVASKTMTVTGALAGSNTFALTGAATLSGNVSVVSASHLTAANTVYAKSVLFSQAGAVVSGVVSAVSTDNYTITGLADASVLIINPDTRNIDLTGLTAPTNLTTLVSGGNGAKILYLQNSGGTYKITLKDRNISSTATNRFVGVGNADVIIPSGGSVTLLYTVAESRWRVLAQVEAHVTRTQIATNVATVTPNADENDLVTATSQSQGLTIANPSPAATVVDGQKLIIRIKDAGYVQALSWGTQYRAIQSSLPGYTVALKTLYLGFIYNAADTKWDLVANAQEA
jgi:hypothetical protein